MYLPAGDGVAARMKGMLATQSAYDVDTKSTDLAQVHIEAMSNVGYESGTVYHPYGAETATGNDASQDGGAATAAGGAGYLEVALGTPGGATLDVVIQDSADNATFADIITFAQVLGSGAPNAQRVAVSGNVRRYVRSKRTIAGSSPSFSYIVGFHRK